MTRDREHLDVLARHACGNLKTILDLSAARNLVPASIGSVHVNLSDHVVNFVQEHIHSVLQLEVLLLLHSDRGDWTASRIASEMRIPEHMAESHLQDLELRGLLQRDATSESYRFEASNPEIAAPVAALAEAYRDMRYSVINLIFSVPGDGARSLAEAFRVRKRRDD